MKFSCHPVGGLSLLLLLAFGADLRADLIPWTYNWSRSPGDVHADNPGTGSITLTVDPATHHAVGDSDIVATNLKTVSSATASNPDIFTGKGYTLTLSLTDQLSGKSKSMTFTGVLNGQLTAASSNIQNTFTGMTTQQLVIGDNVYTTTIGPYTPPGPPASSNYGTISAHAMVTVITVPEPGSLALTMLGVAFVGVGRRWLPSRGRRAVK